MAEIAGLVLGGIPIAIWAVESYAESVKTLFKYRTSILILRAKLAIQRRDLEITLLNVGLDSQSSLVDLRECFESKYSSIRPELELIVQCMTEAMEQLFKSLNIDVEGKPIVQHGMAIRGWHRFKHSVTIKKLNKVVEELRKYNEDLRRCLERSEVPVEDNSRKVQNLKRRFSLQRCDLIRQNLRSLHRALESGLRCACSLPHQAAIDLNWSACEHDEMQSFKLAVSYGLDCHLLLPSWRNIHVTCASESTKTENTVPLLLSPPLTPTRAPSPESSIRSRIARFASAPSLSRTSTPPRPSPTPATASVTNLSASSRTYVTSTVPKITSLCVEVRKECSPWKLEGSLEDLNDHRARSFLLKHNQVDGLKIIKTVTVKSLLTDKVHSNTPLAYADLSAKQRHGIAACLAWSALHLSGTWFDEQWDEKQACIFVEKDEEGKEMFSPHPCISYTFPSSTTSGDQNSNESFKDLIFSLGILLLELGSNKPPSELQRGNGAKASFEYDVAVDKVRLLAGDSYGDAVQRCIKFCFEGRDVHKTFDLSTFRQQFFNTVVAPVQATYLTFAELMSD